MFSLIKGIIWLAGVVVISVFVLDYFGYEFNKNYFSESKDECQRRLRDCQAEYIHQGLDNAQCDFNCLNMGLLIKKQSR